LRAHSRAVNFVWNYCNETQRKAVKDGRKWLTAFDLNYLTAGSCTELNLPANSITAVCKQFEKSRKQHSRPWLRFRGRKSLGWVPFRAEDIKDMGAGFRFRKKVYQVFKSRDLPEGSRILDGGSFTQDAKGKWYLNIVVDMPTASQRTDSAPVGIDLGLSTFATLSTGEKIEAKQFFRNTENRLAQAQRGRKKRLIKRIHAKIANQRRDHQHKASARIVRKFNQIYIGDVNCTGLAKTRLAKSVGDASWSTFREMLAYKSIREGATFKIVSERFSTQTCSQCNSIGGPKGYAGLNERIWTCVHCGHTHDRDVNAALNILRLGHQAPVQGARVSA
jgi:IS605 OrfB family transposase